MAFKLLKFSLFHSLTEKERKTPCLALSLRIQYMYLFHSVA